MKLLYKGDPRVVELAERLKLRPGTVYRLSHFVYPFETEGKVLIKNTLTRQVYELDKNEWVALKEGTLPEETRDMLARFCFLVEKEYDEVSQYWLALNTLRALKKKPRGISYYTILTTTACNARCFYCYEEGMRFRSMTTETADAVAEFISRTKIDGAPRIHWFGGEPLMGVPTISRICRILRDKGVEFTSEITTNGTLLTPEIAQEAKELWNLKKAQVSMDGAREDYEARKRYVDPANCNYDAAMRAVELFSDTGAFVAIRCNYDAENLPRIGEFFNDCRERFKDRKNIQVYTAQLFHSADEQESCEQYVAAKAVEADYGKPSAGRSLIVDHDMRTSHCMADLTGSSIIIGTEGELHICELELDATPIGTVFDETPPAWPAPLTGMADICRDCCFLPDCTPFRKFRCPIVPISCKMQMIADTESDLRKTLQEYEEKEKEAAAETGDCETAVPEDDSPHRDTLC